MLKPRTLPLTQGTRPSKHAQRNAGAISLVCETIRSECLKMVETEGCHGTLEFKIDVVDQDLVLLDFAPRQRTKLK